MDHLTVSRPFSARILRRLMRSVPLSGGYSLALKVGERSFETPVMNDAVNNGPDAALLEMYSRVLPGLDGTFLDIGANVGQTLLAVRSVAPAMPYIGLEPNVSCLAYVRTLVHMNAIDDAVLLPVALMESTGFLELHQYSETQTDSSASLIGNFRPEQAVARKVYVPAFSWGGIEALFADRSFAFVKIDVEGAELEVLLSLEVALRTHRPWVGIEILPVYRPDYGERFERQQAVEALFDCLDYITMRVKKDPMHNFLLLERIDEIGIHDNLSDSDYLVVPAEAAGRLSDMNVAIRGLD